ncbi:hypothetical protein [Yinghuangia aomiensis]|uniref:hypothetical protein n=1 Tax=Yinghuangia aomiensis TaxID=676205 RepID=UPI0031F0F832
MEEAGGALEVVRAIGEGVPALTLVVVHREEVECVADAVGAVRGGDLGADECGDELVGCRRLGVGESGEVVGDEGAGELQVDEELAIGPVRRAWPGPARARTRFASRS